MRFVLIVFLFSPFARSQSVPTYKNVVLSEGNFKFPLQPGDREEYAQYCPKDRCICEADISYVRMIVPGNAATKVINRRLRADASRIGCSYLSANATMQQEVTHLSRHLVSVMEQGYSQMIATGGSCHESSVVYTFDLVSGRELRLADVISKASLSELRPTLPESLVQNEKAAPERDLKAAKSALAALSDEELMKQSLLIRNGRLFTDVKGYLFGCVGGTLHLAEIPASMITLPLVRQDLAGK